MFGLHTIISPQTQNSSQTGNNRTGFFRNLFYRFLPQRPQNAIPIENTTPATARVVENETVITEARIIEDDNDTPDKKTTTLTATAIKTETGITPKR